MGNSNSAFNSINQGFPMVTLDNIALEGDDCCQRARLRPRDLAWEEVFPSACSTCTNAACQFLRLRGTRSHTRKVGIPQSPTAACKAPAEHQATCHRLSTNQERIHLQRHCGQTLQPAADGISGETRGSKVDII